MGCKIFYLDETWVNRNHAKHVLWRYKKEGSKYFMYEGGMDLPSGEGQRLIVVHISTYIYTYNCLNTVLISLYYTFVDMATTFKHILIFLIC